MKKKTFLEVSYIAWEAEYQIDLDFSLDGKITLILLYAATFTEYLFFGSLNQILPDVQ